MSKQTKTCRRCLQDKPEDAFSLDGGRRIRTCKACRAEHWRLVHADKRQAEKERRENQHFNQLMAGWIYRRSRP